MLFWSLVFQHQILGPLPRDIRSLTPEKIIWLLTVCLVFVAVHSVQWVYHILFNENTGTEPKPKQYR